MLKKLSILILMLFFWSKSDAQFGLSWEFATDGFIDIEPAIDLENTVYLASRDDHIYAIDSSGNLKWKFKPDIRCVYTQISVGIHGTVYVGTDGVLYALDKNGNLVWQNEIDDFHIKFAVSDENIIYVTGSSYFVYAIGKDGKLLWKRKYGTRYNPVIAPDGSLYLNTGHFFIALSNHGDFKWHYEKYAKNPGDFIVGNNGMIYLAQGGFLTAINPFGKKVWEKHFGQGMMFQPILDTNERMCVITGYDSLHVLKTDGSLQLSHETVFSLEQLLVFGANGDLFFSQGADIVKLEPDGNIEKILDLSRSPSSALKIDNAGRLIVTYDNGTISCFEIDNDSLFGEWPCIGRDSRNSYNSFNENFLVAKINGLDTLFVPTNEDLVLSADSSFNINGQPLNYNWNVIEKPITSTVETSQDNQSEFRLSFGEYDIGLYRVSVDLTDAKGNMSNDVATVFCGVNWRINIGEYFHAPAIGPLGNIYISTTTGIVYSISPEGEVLWRRKVSHECTTAPVVANDGTIYVGTKNYSLQALTNQGQLKWEIPSYNELTSLALDEAKGVIVANKASNIMILDVETGAAKWNVGTLEDVADNSIVIGPDGTLFIGSIDGDLTVINMEEDIYWSKSFGRKLNSPIIMDGDGILYLCVNYTKIIAVQPDGHIKWSYESGLRSYNIVLDAENKLVISSIDGMLYSLSSEGALLWQTEFDYTLYGAPVVSANGSIYVGAQYDEVMGDRILALDSQGNILWEFKSKLGYSAIPALSDDGVLYTYGNSGQLLAIQVGNEGLANSAWPRVGHDNQNTSNVQSKITTVNRNPFKSEDKGTEDSLSLFPNPSNSNVTISFNILTKSHVLITVYDLLGREVAVLKDELAEEGPHRIKWDAVEIPSGIYFVRIYNQGNVLTRKCLFVK